MKWFVAAVLLCSAGLSLAKDTTTVYVTRTRYAVSSGSFSSLSTIATPSISVGTLNLDPYSQNATSSASSKTSHGGTAQTTVSLFNACKGPAERCDSQVYTYFGEVLSADPTATVYAVDCAASKNSTVCGLQPVTVTQAPSAYIRLQSQKNDASAVYLSCDITDTSSSAICKQGNTNIGQAPASAAVTGVSAFVTNSANATDVLTSTLTFGPSDIHYNALVITAGVEKLSSSTRTPVAPTSVTNIGTQPTQTPNAAPVVQSRFGASLAGLLAGSFAVLML